MQKSDLEFNNTMSITAFLQEEGASELEIATNPHTGKLFFVTDIGISGKVSNEADLDQDELRVSLCNDGEESFFMVHKHSQSNVVKRFTL